MNNNIYLRPLAFADAAVSWHWRNNADIWKFTGYDPSIKTITPEIEETWIRDVLSRANERRYAICLADNDRYIGNVQLLGISDIDAEFHLFIGEPAFWGKGIGKQASAMMLDIAFLELGLKLVKLQVYQENVAALRIYKNLGFVQQEPGGLSEPGLVDMQLNHEQYLSDHLKQIL